MKMDLRGDVYVDIESDESVLTKEVMDNYEKHFYNLSEESDFNKFETQLEKHTAHIARWYAKNEWIEELEGYGNLNKIVKNVCVESDFIYID